MRKVQVYPVPGRNSMQYWGRVARPWRVFWNFAILEFCRFLPFLEVKNFLLRNLLGMRIGGGASIGLMVMFDVLHPEYIEIGEEAIIGYNSTLLSHEFLPGEYRLGRVRVGRGVLIGANTTVLPGVEIGDGSLVGACSLVNSDLPAGVLAAGVPARTIRRLGEEG